MDFVPSSPHSPTTFPFMCFFFGEIEGEDVGRGKGWGGQGKAFGGLSE